MLQSTGAKRKRKGEKATILKKKCGCGGGAGALTLISGAVISHRHHLSVISHRQPFHPSCLIINALCLWNVVFPPSQIEDSRPPSPLLNFPFAFHSSKNSFFPLMTTDIHLFHPNYYQIMIWCL